jgi:hypothetical protein
MSGKALGEIADAVWHRRPGVKVNGIIGICLGGMTINSMFLCFMAVFIRYCP